MPPMTLTFASIYSGKRTDEIVRGDQMLALPFQN
jgi:hypothetical protein